MGKDVEWVEFFEDDKRYADVINGIAFAGRQIVSEDDLLELDTRAGKKARDLIRKTKIGVNFAIIGIENQDEVDYEFPVRIMEYDLKQYKKQVSDIRRIQNTDVFKTEVRQVFDFIRCAEDKKALLDLVSSDSSFQNISIDTYDVISKYANLGEEAVRIERYLGKDGSINMCKGIRDLMDDSKTEGILSAKQVIRLDEQGVEVPEIVKQTGLSVQEVLEILE